MTDLQASPWYEMGADAGENAALAVELDLDLARNYLDGRAPDKLTCPDPMDGRTLAEVLGTKVFPVEAPMDYKTGFEETWEDILTERCAEMVAEDRP